MARARAAGFVLALAGLAAGCLEVSEAVPRSSDAGGANSGATGGTAPGDSGVPGGDAGAGGVGAGDAAGGGTFAVKGVIFDGVDDWLNLPAPFNGGVDSKTVTGSMWFKHAASGWAQCVGPEAAGSGGPNQLEWTQDNRFRVVWRKAGGGTACDLQTSPITSTTAWHHIAFSLDLNDPMHRSLVVDGVSSLSVAAYNDVFMDNTGNQWGLFADNGANQKFQGEVAELWLALGQYLDLSIPANREKFRDANGKPVDLGASGELPTGTPPTIYLRLRPGETANQFAINRGTGGGFTLNGTLEVAATSPSD